MLLRMRNGPAVSGHEPSSWQLVREANRSRNLSTKPNLYNHIDYKEYVLDITLKLHIVLHVIYNIIQLIYRVHILYRVAHNQRTTEGCVLRGQTKGREKTDLGSSEGDGAAPSHKGEGPSDWGEGDRAAP